MWVFSILFVLNGHAIPGREVSFGSQQACEVARVDYQAKAPGATITPCTFERRDRRRR